MWWPVWPHSSAGHSLTLLCMPAHAYVCTAAFGMFKNEAGRGYFGSNHVKSKQRTEATCLCCFLSNSLELDSQGWFTQAGCLFQLQQGGALLLSGWLEGHDVRQGPGWKVHPYTSPTGLLLTVLPSPSEMPRLCPHQTHGVCSPHLSEGHCSTLNVLYRKRLQIVPLSKGWS